MLRAGAPSDDGSDKPLPSDQGASGGGRARACNLMTCSTASTQCCPTTATRWVIDRSSLQLWGGVEDASFGLGASSYRATRPPSSLRSLERWTSRRVCLCRCRRLTHKSPTPPTNQRACHKPTTNTKPHHNGLTWHSRRTTNGLRRLSPTCHDHLHTN
jgi:hypothetical protein